MNEKRKAAIYARYSSDNQRDESIDAQICAIEKYAQQNEILIVSTYIDRAKSATSDQRPSFQEMIKMSETGLFDTIIVHKLDRFARSKYDSAIYKQKLKANKVQLISVTEQLDGSPESIILESVLEAMAEYYSKNLAREVAKGLKENAKVACHTGGIPPLGYDVIDKKLVINEREAKAVKIIFRMYAEGYGYGDIIARLNQSGYRTKRGKSFVKNSLFEILRNEKYRGVFIYNATAPKSVSGTYDRHAYKDDSEIIRIKDGCPAIVSEEIFEAVAKRRQENRHKFQTNRGRQKYLLSGLVYCGHCKSPMHANRRRTDCELTYRCQKRSSSYQCEAKEINMPRLEQQVLDTLKAKIFSARRVSAIMELIDQYAESQDSMQSDRVQGIESSLNEVYIAKDNILQAVENGIASSHFGARLDELKQQEEQLRAKLMIVNQPQQFHVTKKDILLLNNRFNQMVKEQDIMGLRKIILDFVDCITVTDGIAEISLKISFGDVTIHNGITPMRESTSIA